MNAIITQSLNKKVSVNQQICLEYVETRSNKAFDAMYKIMKPGVMKVIKKFNLSDEEVEDLTTQVFLVVMNRIDKYSDVYYFSTWIYKIARNETISYLAKRNKSISMDSEKFGQKAMMEVYTKNIETMDEDIICLGDYTRGEKSAMKLYDIIMDSIDTLEEPYRTVMLDKLVNKKLRRVMAAEQNEPLGTIHTRIRKAEQILRERISKSHPDLVEIYRTSLLSKS